jgi:hypothetical protein
MRPRADAGGIDAVPDWFAGCGMLGAGDFATGCSPGRRGSARESQTFPASARATPGSSRSGDAASRQEAPSASAGNAGGIDAVPDWFAGCGMLGAGDFATGCSPGRRGIARESQTFPASARATPGSSRSGDAASRREAPSASAGNAGGIDAVPDWFAGCGMLGAGDFATGRSPGRRGIARESQTFPASARATPGSSRSRISDPPLKPPSCRTGMGWTRLFGCLVSSSRRA